MNSLKIVQVDALTQLFNRSGWQSAVQKSIEATQGGATDVKAVLFIDLDRFKWVNDSLGHDAGDLLLQKVSRLIESCLVLEGSQADIAGRFGGDEFVVWVQHSNSIAKLDLLANAIVKKIAQPICLSDGCCDENTEVEIGASIGIARFSQDAAGIEELLKYADLAMYRAKHSGRNQVVYYKPEMMQQIEWRRQVQVQLRKALKQQQLTLDYMPIFDSKNQEVVALEARLNLKNCPDLMGMDVVQLLSIAESSQVGLVLGEWMVTEAIRFNHQLLQAGIEVACSVEIRPSHFQQKEFVDWLSEQLDEYELPPELLIVSLSECCLNSQRFSVLNQLNALSHLGMEIAIRSFGEGNWSLLRLHDWPIDQLNLSSRFIREMTSNRTISAMTGALIEMGLMLNKKVVAYGVSSAEQIAFLNSVGCFLVQGPYLSDALSAEEMEVHLLQNRVENMVEFTPYYGEEE
ncbi:diguanylate cyclase/phosphodiesterase (GGDEF & EAL domains) with PAS/PAC sensor(s) [hydrothermal vent metagenome]|uniref:Diguanylate cyclase/phosphodiesterase (GGDEF & EAL domains) with PAS/PAC sensor(S) n=1 Tax=hydrothermal vent metagenome TaxID=652676 RepID=A0A3B0VRS8_9ZZZZ